MFWLCCRRPAAWRAICPKSYYAAEGFFACALLTPCKPSLTTEKKPGSAFCVARSPDRPLASKSYCASVGFFACARLTPCRPSLTTETKLGSAFCVSQVSWQGTSPKILLRLGRIFCLCPAHTLQAIHHRKEAGKRVLCSPAPEEAACGKILLRRGRNFFGRPCLPHSLSIFASPPLLKQRPHCFLDEALGFGLLPRLVSVYRGSNPPRRGFLHFCFCFGFCRAFKGQIFQGIQQSTLKALFPYS